MGYPRPLRPKERELLETVLPDNRPGYHAYHGRILAMAVIAQGRRGEGDMVLGFPGQEPDIQSPLPPVIAFGMVETTRDTFTISVREEMQGQINAEIVSGSQQEIPDHFEEKRRWTYSTWLPGARSPASDGPVREVPIDRDVTLAFATLEKRIWVYERPGGMVHLIPITNYYNELMRHKHIRDSRIALSSSRFWNDLEGYSADDLRAAFISYNAVKRRVVLHTDAVAPPTRSIGAYLKTLWRKGQ